MHRNSRLEKTNKMQQCADIYLLLNYSTCFGRPSRPSSAVHKTVVAASGTDHTIWGSKLLQTWPRDLMVCHPCCVRSVIKSCSVYISIYTYSHEHNNITITSNIWDTTTCFGPDNGLHTGPKHVVLSYISLLIVILLCSWLFVYIGIYTPQLCITWPRGHVWRSLLTR